MLTAAELNQRGGSGFVYRITAKPLGAELTVSTETDHLNVPAGGTAVLKLTRTGHKKPVTITASDVPPGWSVSPTILGTGQMQGVMTMTHTGDSASPLFVPSLQLRASSEDPVIHTPAVQKRYANWITIPESLSVTLAVATTDATPFRLTMKPERIEVAQKSEAKVEIIATRSEGTTEPITLSLQTVTVNKKAVPVLPANVTTKFEPIPKDGASGTVTFSGSDKAVPGEYTVVVLGTLKRGKQTFVVPAASIPLRIKPAQSDSAQ